MKYSLFLTFVFLTAISYAQDGKKEYDIFFKELLDSRESKRKTQQEEIKSYEDIICTYWTAEIDKTNFGSVIQNIQNIGFIFLSDGLVLVVMNTYESINFDDQDDTARGMNTVYYIYSLFSYEIKEDKIVFDLWIAYLEDGYLNISYNAADFGKYRLEFKFNNYTGSAEVIEIDLEGNEN